MQNKYKILIVTILAAAIGGGIWYYTSLGDGEKNSKNNNLNHPFTNPDLKARYTDPDLNFFVDYPEGFTVNNTGEENVKVLVFSKANSEESFQIFIMPYDEPGPITPERILIDQPDIVMKDPQTVPIAGEEALVFFSTDPDIGDVREVWFVHQDRLYQTSTYAKYDELLAKVMRTFKFK